MDLMHITDDLTMVNEGHVGGFIIEKDPATYTPYLWEYLCKKFNIKTVLDVGCGMGHAVHPKNIQSIRFYPNAIHSPVDSKKAHQNVS